MKGAVQADMLISINIAVHRDTRLLVATSPELKGLVVHARSQDEMNSRIPQAIKALLEAQGHTVESVSPADDEQTLPDFFATTRKFQAIAA